MRSISGKLTTLQLVCALLVVVILYWVLDRQLSVQMRANFTANADVIASALAKSVEPALISRDITSAQSALDAVLSVPGVQWAYISGTGWQCAGAHIRAAISSRIAGCSWRPRRTSLAFRWQGQLASTLVVRKPVLTGIVGQVYVGFPLAHTRGIHSLDGKGGPRLHHHGAC